MKYLIGVIVVILLSVSSLVAQQDEQALSVLNGMSDKYRAMKGFSSSFTYTLNNPAEDINDSFKGEISISGRKYRLELGSQQIINDGTTMWTYMPDVQEVNIADYDPEEEELSLNNIFDVYKKGYKYIMNADFTSASVNVVDLIPEDKDNEFFKIRMFINSGNAELEKFQIFEKSGNRYIYSIEKFDEKSSFPSGTFEFNTSAYPNVEVIDFR